MGYGEANANDPSVFQRFGVWYIWYFGRVLLQECLLRNTEPYDLRGFCRIIIPSKQGEANYFGNDQAEAGKGLEKELPLVSSGIFSTGPTERTSKKPEYLIALATSLRIRWERSHSNLDVILGAAKSWLPSPCWFLWNCGPLQSRLPKIASLGFSIWINTGYKP